MASAGASNPWTTGTGPDPSDIHEVYEGDSSDDEDVEFTYPGDYSTHMQELFDGEEPAGEDEEEEEEESFIYNGIDADTSASYKDQLRDVLDQDQDETESDNDVLEVEKSLINELQDESHAEDSVCMYKITGRL